jgi:hypothetical protein
VVAMSLTAVAQTGPKSPLYLTIYDGGSNHIAVVQGNSITTFPMVYQGFEMPIAVYGDVRTTGSFAF